MAGSNMDSLINVRLFLIYDVSNEFLWPYLVLKKKCVPRRVRSQSAEFHGQSANVRDKSRRAGRRRRQIF